MWEEIRVTFKDGTSTLAWFDKEDGNIQEFLMEVAEQCGLSASDVKKYKRTGKTANAGE